MNPLRLIDQTNKLWINYEGGNVENLMRTYFNLPHLEVDKLNLAGFSESKKIEAIMNKVLSLPKSMKKQILSSNNLHISIASNTGLVGHEGHAYSLKPKMILQLAKKYGSSEKILAEFNKSITDFFEKPVTEHIIGKILKEMMNFSHSLCDGIENYPLLCILSKPSIAGCKTYQDLWEYIESEITTSGFFDETMGKLRETVSI